MTYQADYEWSIDWADDGYAHPHAVIPETDVWRYSMAWGSDLAPGSRGMGVALDAGHLTLFRTDGRYYKPDAGLTLAQLTGIHNWRLRIGGVFQVGGRCEPLLGDPLGPLVKPQAWRLEGSSTPELTSAGNIEGVSGTTDEVLAALDTHSGLTVTSSGELPLSGSASYVGGWATLVNTMATLLGGWAISRGNGTIRIVTPADIAGGAPTFDLTEAHNLGRELTGTALAHGLVRTRFYYPGYGQAVGQLVMQGANEARYGRRLIRIPEGWFTIYDLVYVLPAITRHATPPRMVQVDLVDEHESEVTALAMTGAMVPGNLVNVTIPDVQNNATTYPTMVARVELRGGHGLKPSRLVRGLSVFADPSPQPSAVFPANAPPAIVLSLHTVNTVRITWSDDGGGAVDLVRFQIGVSAPVDASTVSAGNVNGTYDDMPGDGYWYYGLRRGGVNGPLAGPILVGTPQYVNPDNQPPAPADGLWWRGGLTASPSLADATTNPAAAYGLVAVKPNYTVVAAYSSGSTVGKSVSYDDPVEFTGRIAHNGIGSMRESSDGLLFLSTQLVGGQRTVNANAALEAFKEAFPYAQLINDDGSAEGTPEAGFPSSRLRPVFLRDGGTSVAGALEYDLGGGNSQQFFIESAAWVRFWRSLPIPSAPTLRERFNNVEVSWDATQAWIVDIARAPTGERGALVSVIRTGADGGLYTDSNPGDGTWDYRVRFPSGSNGEWSPWATVTVS